jgi:superfamily I DNA and RNA helicase
LQNYPDGNSAYRYYCAKNSTPQEVEEKIRAAYSVFTNVQEDLGKLTRDKLEKITKEAILKDQKYARSIGEKLVVLKGRAGTGKTIKLIHIAYDLCKKRDDRCLILTYNKALVSDIRRTIALAKVRSDLDSGAVEVETIHKFIRDLVIGFGVFQEGGRRDFLNDYEELKNELLSLLRERVVTSEDINALMKANYDQLVWDHILIDEGQDWPQNEKDILFFLFDSKNLS